MRIKRKFCGWTLFGWPHFQEFATPLQGSRSTGFSPEAQSVLEGGLVLTIEERLFLLEDE
jgi:hypothetical protein